MNRIPPIRNLIAPRPGEYRSAVQLYIPSLKAKKVWRGIYEILRTFSFQLPVPDVKASFDMSFGLFGKRFHPTLFRPNYFHVGLDFFVPTRTRIHPITSGNLEYSGFALVNGNYILISHPDIQTEDGFTLQSIYMHLRKLEVKFSSYQKMLREISLRTYPNIIISRDMTIGTVGATGCEEFTPPHLHLQVEFRHKDGTVVVIDPAELFRLSHAENLSRNVRSVKSFFKFVDEHREMLRPWMRVWKAKYRDV